MPPEKKKQPSDKEVHVVAKWLGQMLLENDTPGYCFFAVSIRKSTSSLCPTFLRFRLLSPSCFPSDPVSTVLIISGGDLVLSPPLMAHYLEIATAAADSVLPPLVEKIGVKNDLTVLPKEFTLNFTTGHVVDGVLHMVSSSGTLARGSVWLTGLKQGLLVSIGN